MYELYYALTRCSAPLLNKLLTSRLSKGKEDPLRYLEKKAITNKQRPKGQLVWLHAASVGEAQSAQILIKKISDHCKTAHILVTTGTLTSATLMERNLPANAFHQFAPLDHPKWVEAFLDHWKPDLALWMESELWPNMLMSISKRHIPAYLINARLSEKSYKSWKLLRPLANDILSTFDKIFCQTQNDKDHFSDLGYSRCVVTDNIKYSAAPLSYDQSTLAKLQKVFKDRKSWVYASTHDGEEDIALKIHKSLKVQIPDLLTIIIPRHPERRSDIIKQLDNQGASITLRSQESESDIQNTDIYIADTLGETGLFYKFCPIACIGRSLSNDGGGGHNPIEAAQLNCAVLHGPNVQNLAEIYSEMHKSHAAIKCNTSTELEHNLRKLLTDAAALKEYQDKAMQFAHSKSGAIEKVMDELTPALDTLKDLNHAA